MASASLTDQQLGWIRDELGSEPDDDTLQDHYTALGHWILVALRVLRRRHADAVAGGTSTPASVSVPGVVAVSASRTDVRALAGQIDRLQARYETETGDDLPGDTVGGGVLSRVTWR